MPTIQELATRLTSDPDFKDADALVSEVAKGGVQQLVELWRAIDALAESGATPSSQCEIACDIVVEHIALTPGEGRVEALLALLAHEGMGRLYRRRSRDLVIRGFASRLGYAQPKEALVAMLEHASSTAVDADRLELFACWMHEIVLCGTPLDEEPAVRAFRERLAVMGHPLAPFPLRLLSSEREAPTYMPMYGAEAIRQAVSVLERGPVTTHTIPPPGEVKTPTVTVQHDEPRLARLREAVAPWHATGKVEAHVLALEPHVTSGIGKWLLRALPLEATRGDALHVSRVTADAVWGALFAAAANGGGSGSGLGGAYGRRAAWTSFAALVGARPGTPLDNVERMASSTAFAMFGGTRFFYDVAWDVGVVALGSDGASVAALAATDTTDFD